MIKYIIKRILYLIPVMLGVTFIVFSLLSMTSGDPAKMILGEMADETQLAKTREELGLNDPFLVQYGNYVKKLVVDFDFGTSYARKTPVIEEIVKVFPNTLKLAIVANVIAIVVGVTFGVVSAVKQYSIIDNIISVIALFGVSMPMFWVGMLMILLFSLRLGLLPPSGFDSWKAMIMPSIALAAQGIAVFTRMTRSTMLEIIRQDYVRTAEAKGQKDIIIIAKHAFRNALIPIITVMGLQFGNLLGGAILTESIFSISGLGRLMIESIKMRDYPMVQGSVLFIAIMFSLVNLVVDILYTVVDPRVTAS